MTSSSSLLLCVASVFCSVGAAESEFWTPWYSRDRPAGSGDWETLRNLKKTYPICGDYEPVGVEARTVRSKVPALESGRKIRVLSPKVGLVCLNKDQGGRRRCRNYEVRFFCRNNKPTEVSVDDALFLKNHSVSEGMAGYPGSSLVKLPGYLSQSSSPAVAFVSPAKISAGSSIRLRCGDKAGEVCAFYITLYHCNKCASGHNGGLPELLSKSRRFEMYSCAPRFAIDGTEYEMVTYRVAVSPAKSIVLPRLKNDLDHWVVFKTSFIRDWCPKAKGSLPLVPGTRVAECACLNNNK